VARLLDTRSKEILCEAILKGTAPPSDVESRSARDAAKRAALEAEAALENTTRRWTEMRTNLDNHRDIINPEAAAEARERNEKKAALRVQAAELRQTMESHGLDRVQFGRIMDENAALDAEIGELLRKLERGEQKEDMYRRVFDSNASLPGANGERTRAETNEDVEMQ
ncbi:hypothetical protein PFISCL1PPCAC_17810, partial [Pristionchus fissidentatus]